MSKKSWNIFFQKLLTKFGDIVGGSSSDEGVFTKSNGIGDVSSGSVFQPFKSQDFCVVASEEAKSVPTSIHPDSSSQVHNNVESQKVKSNPSAVVDKKDDDSTDSVSFQLKDIEEAEVIHTDSTNPESSKELAVLHNKLNCPDCFHIGLDDSRSIFDR
ncbi:hypothetical protein MKW98_018818, partial [Papaver atlanticum]